MSVYHVVALSVLNAIGHRGSKILVALYALQLEASAWMVGVLAATYAVFPLLLAVHAGKLSDRIGDRVPILAGGAVMVVGLALPFMQGSIAMLLLCAALVGLGHIYFHVSVHHLIGSLGDKQARTKNFSIFSLGASIAAFIGPSLTGVSIDTHGFGATALLLATICGLPLVVVLLVPGLLPARAGRGAHDESNSAFDLLRNQGLRRTFILGGVTLTGIELFNFYFPIYGESIGLSASAIGIVLSAYAVAAFVVRMLMPRLALRFTEIGLLTAALFIGAAVYFLVPFVGNFGVLALASFVLGLGLGTAQPLSIILTYNHAPKERTGEALGLRLMVNKLIQLGVPLAFGGMSAALGVAPVFWACATFLLGGGVLAVKDRRDQRPTGSTTARPVASAKSESP
jgi:predicted MFS family arabinose efflux permease